MPGINKLAKDTLIYGISVVLNPLVQTFILLRLLTSRLDTYDYGSYTYFYAAAGVLLILFSMRMETTYFRMAGEAPEEKVYANAWRTVIIFSSFLSLVLLAGAGVVADFFENPAFRRYVIYLAAILWLDAFIAIPFARLRHQERSLKFSLLKIGNVLLTLMLILVYLLVLPDLTRQLPDQWQVYVTEPYWLDGIFVANLLASFLLALYFSSEVSVLFEKASDPTLLKKILSYTLPLILIGLAGNANQLLDRLLMPFLTGNSVAEGMSNTGVYGGATKVAAIMLLFTKAFNYAFDPYIFKRYSQDKDTSVYARIAHYFTIVSGVIFVGAVAFSFLLEHLLGSPQFREGMRYVPVLLLAYFMVGIYYHFSIWYKLKDRTHYGAVIAVLGVVVTLLCNLWLVPDLGAYGAPVAMIINFGFMSVLCVLWGRRFLQVDYRFGRMALHLLLSIGFVYFFVNYWQPDHKSWWWGPVFFLVYFLFVLFVERDSLGWMRSLLNDKK